MDETQTSPWSPAAEPPTIPPDSPRRRGILAVLFLAALAVVATLPGWLPKRVYVPTDAIMGLTPWRDAGAVDVPANAEVLFDQTVEFVPWTIYAVQRLKAGEFPLWNPYQQLGAPFIGAGQTAVFSPTTLIHLSLPPTWSWTLAAALKLFFAGWGVWLLVGRYGQSPAGRLLSASAFMLCGFCVVWLNHPHTVAVALLPWAILMVEKIIDRPTILRTVAAALIIALQFLGGHPGTSIHLLLACGMVYGIRLVWLSPKPALKAAPALVLAIAIGAALAGAQLLPMKQYVDGSAAKVVREAGMRDAAPGGSWVKALSGLKNLVGVIHPHAFGSPDGVTPFSMYTFLPNSNEIAGGFVGLLPLLLAVAGIAWRSGPGKRMWTIIAVVSIIIAAELPGVRSLVNRAPVLGQVQNGRLVVVLALALAILSGFGLDAVMQKLAAGWEARKTRKILRWSAIILAAMSIVGAIGITVARGPIIRFGEKSVRSIYNNPKTSADGHEHPIEKDLAHVKRIHREFVLISIRLLIPAGVLALCFAALRARDRWPHSVPLTGSTPFVAIALAELLIFAIPYNRGSSAWTYPAGDTVVAQNPAIRWLKDRQTQTLSDPSRFVGRYTAVSPELATAYGLFDVRGFDAIVPVRLAVWMTLVDRDPMAYGDAPAKFRKEFKRLVSENDENMKLLGLRYLLGRPGMDSPGDVWRKVYPAGEQVDRNAEIYEMKDPLPRAYLAKSARIFGSGGEVAAHIKAEGVKPREQVLLDRDFPAETAELLKDVGGWETLSGSGRGTVNFILDTPERVELRVDLSDRGWLVLADTYFEGWQVRVKRPGQPGLGERLPILPAFGIVRAVPLTKGGQYDVIFEYKPTSFRHGIFLSAGAGVLILLLLGWRMFGPTFGENKP